MGPNKTVDDILAKFGIEALNEMQKQALVTIPEAVNTVLLSPTGTGKTLGFLLPLLQVIDDDVESVQVLILVPSRELAIQIEQVARAMGSGLKINAVYGGRNIVKDKAELKNPPAILVGTPGRVSDHLRRGVVDASTIHTLVLDEFDKSLEVGFESEMKSIIRALTQLKKRVLTSATQGVEIPNFTGARLAKVLDFLGQTSSNLQLFKVQSPEKDKLNTLVDTLRHLQQGPGIIFVNFKDGLQRISEKLDEEGIDHGCFFGGIDQQDRERVLIKFRNGSHRLLLATDLAARGLDIPQVKFIIHYHLPLKAEEFTHRNGRTARMHEDGAAYLIQGPTERLPGFVGDLQSIELEPHQWESPNFTTLFISGGRRDKISKGDIAGALFKQCGLEKAQVGVIELKQDCAFVGVEAKVAKLAMEKLSGYRLKQKKVKVVLI